MKLWGEPKEGEYSLKWHIIELYYDAKQYLSRLYERFYWFLIIYLVDNEWIECINCKEGVEVISLTEDDECIVCGQWIDFR